MATAALKLEIRDRPERWGVAALLVTAMFFCYAHRGALSVAAPYLREQLGLSRSVMGLLLAAFFWSYSLLQVPAGWLVDRFGVMRGYAAGFALWSLALACTGYARTVVALIALRLLLGIGQSSAFPASARAVSNWFQVRERDTVTACYLTGVRLGHRSVLGIFIGFFAYDYVWYVFTNWLPSYLVEERGFTTREMGIYSSVPFVGMSLVIMLSGIVSDALVRRGYAEVRVRKALIATGLTVACLVVPAAMVSDKMVAVWLLTFSLSGLAIATPNTWTLTQAVCSPHIVGTVSGMQNFGGNLGGSIAPALTGYIADQTGSFVLALSLCGVILVIGILAYLLLVSKMATD